MKDLDGKTFFYQKRYVPKEMRFEDPLPDLKYLSKKNSHQFCSACAHSRTVEQFNIPKVILALFIYKGLSIYDDVIYVL